MNVLSYAALLQGQRTVLSKEVGSLRFLSALISVVSGIFVLQGSTIKICRTAFWIDSQTLIPDITGGDV